MLNPHKSHLPAYFALGLGILMMGFGAIFVRWANAPGTVTVFYRMTIAAVVLALPFFQRVKANGSLSRSGLRFAILGGLFFACDLALWASGVMLSGANNPTLLANTAPVWVGVGALIFFRERLNARFWGGLSLAMGGAVAILGLDTLRAASLGLGSLFGLLAAFFYAGYFLLTQRGRESLDALSYLWPATVSASLALIVLNIALRQPLTGYPAVTYLSFFGLGLMSQVFGWLAVNHALGLLPASVVAPTMLGQPVMTAILAMPLLGETLSPGQIVGGVAVLAGVYIVHRGRTQVNKETGKQGIRA